MEPAHHDHVTEAEYLEQEPASAEKHEFANGYFIAMAGGTPRHNLLTMNVGGELRGRLTHGPCAVLSSDQRVLVEKTRMYAYPDVTVVCGKPLFSAESRLSLANPTLLVEVPWDIEAIVKSDSALAMRWRIATRRNFHFAMARGFAVDGFLSDRAASRAYYCFTRASRPEAR